LDECDTDKNGTIELDEWLEYMSRKQIEEKGEYVPEAIVDDRVAADGSRELLIKWKGYSEDENTWEPADHFEAEDLKSYDEEKAGKGKVDTEDDKDEKEKPEKKKKTKAEKKKPAKSPKKKKPGKPKEEKKTLPGAEKKKLVRSHSIIDFYNQNAGLQTVSGAELDEHFNPKGSEFDLGKDAAFTAFKILIGNFFQIKTEVDKQNMKDVKLEQPIGALKSKGFQVEIVDTESEFLKKLAEETDVAWIISAEKIIDQEPGIEEKFVETVVEFHNGGGGLFIWAENDPFTYHANLILDKLIQLKVSGSTPGTKTLTLGDAKTPGHFGGHLITTGLQHLYEGDSISYFADSKLIPDKLEYLATSSDNQGSLFANNPTLFDKHAGRFVIDTGFTKLFMNWDSAGTARYVKNANVWLLGLDHRIASDAPLRGKAKKKEGEEEWVWQYKHGGWHNYDEEANKMVEAIYQSWVSDPSVDIRTVKSGHWNYMIDFNTMKQTNIEHEAHTSRDLRRIKASESTSRYT
jgi:hypothetical protein